MLNNKIDLNLNIICSVKNVFILQTFNKIICCFASVNYLELNYSLLILQLPSTLTAKRVRVSARFSWIHRTFLKGNLKKGNNLVPLKFYICQCPWELLGAPRHPGND